MRSLSRSRSYLGATPEQTVVSEESGDRIHLDDDEDDGDKPTVLHQA